MTNIKTYNLKKDGNVNLSANFALKEMQLHDSMNEGEPYSYYSDYSNLATARAGSDSNCIKHKDSLTQYWWMITPSSATGQNTYVVNILGNVHGNNATYSGEAASGL